MLEYFSNTVCWQLDVFDLLKAFNLKTLVFGPGGPEEPEEPGGPAQRQWFYLISCVYQHF